MFLFFVLSVPGSSRRRRLGMYTVIFPQVLNAWRFSAKWTLICGFAQFVVFLYYLKWWRSLRWLLPLVYIYFAAFLSWSKALASFYFMSSVSISTQPCWTLAASTRCSARACRRSKYCIWILFLIGFFSVFLVTFIPSMKWDVGIKKWFHLRWVPVLIIGTTEHYWSYLIRARRSCRVISVMISTG